MDRNSPPNRLEVGVVLVADPGIISAGKKDSFSFGRPASALLAPVRSKAPEAASGLPALGSLPSQESSGSQTKKPPTVPFNRTLAYLTFLFVGANSLVNWIFVMQTIPFIARSFLDGQDWNNTLLGSFQAIEVLVQLAMLKLGSANVMLVCVTGVVNALAGLLVAPLTLYTSKTVSVWMLHLICLVLGACSGVYQGSGFAIASMMPENFVASVSAGQGLAGLFVFLVVTGASFAVFDIDTKQGIEGMVWAAFSISACLSVLCSGVFFVVMRQPWAATSLARVRAERAAKRERARRAKAATAAEAARGDLAERSAVAESGLSSGIPSAAVTRDTTLCPEPQEPTATLEEGRGVTDAAAEGHTAEMESRPWTSVFRSALPWLFMTVLHMFISFHLFPKVGPLSWNYDSPPKNYLVICFGVFYVVEFIGRSLPDLHGVRGLGFLHLSRRAFVIAEVSRLLLFVPFILGYALKGVPFINSFYWYCILIAVLSLTQGWLGTLTFYYSVNSVESPVERELTGPMAAIASPLGCVIGLYTATPY
ncbi:nucleoside transporter protein [Besnoitia besnoiti]|uniref:Nucleoside transporter protein n=1 Tax=Besnoitia besnoiti TaxID=94643 RepID=A0A2A9MQJ6_BESBE|nr:nucleoside transporter protein [Besnoitia besnoiti]PFH38517.1 nucleoside transporter protein [Besnoitia besnoiti]